MLCFECGAEMRLVQVAKDSTMPVAGFEHRTWQCSACAAVERRMTFTRERTPAKTEAVEPTQPALPQPIQAGPVEPTQTQPIEPAETIALEPSQTVPVEPAQTMPNEPASAKPAEQVQKEGAESVEPSLTAAVSPPRAIRRTYPEPPGAAPQMNARAKALEEKVRNFKERVTAARKVADDTKRPARFNRNWDIEFRSVPSPSQPSKAASHIKPDEPVLLPAEPIAFPRPLSADESLVSSAAISAGEPIASPEPISADEPVTPVSSTPALTKLRMTLGGLVRGIAPKGFSKAR
jgi:hypothetical protein